MWKRFVAGVLVGLISGLLPGTTSAAIEYYHVDALGSVRAVTDQAGAVIERHDYLPFGEECVSGSCTSNPQMGSGQPKKFVGKERDFETGLDYFGARYMSARAGRFTTQDPVYTLTSNLLDPQRWNRYSYVRNNPLGFLDPDGRWILPVVFALAAFFVLNNANNTNVTNGPPAQPIVPNAVGPAAVVLVHAGPTAVALEAQIAAGMCLTSAVCHNGVLRAAEGLSGAAPGSMGIMPGPLVPNLGRKLDYLLGRGTGNQHNVDQSLGMLGQLKRIGLDDNPTTRQYLTEHFTRVLNDPSSVAGSQAGGKLVRDSLLSGPDGTVKIQSIWEGAKLITAKILGTGAGQ